MKLHHQLLGTTIATAILLISPGMALIPKQPIVQAQTTEELNAAAERLLEQGDEYLEAGQYQAALQAYQQALLIYNHTSNPQGIEAIIRVGYAYGYLGETDKAINMFGNILNFAQENNIPELVQAAQEGLQFAQNQSQSAPNPDNSPQTQADQLYQEGRQLFQQQTAESYQQAIQKFEQALQLDRESGDRSEEARTLSNLGKVYDALGEFQPALDYLQQALTLLQAVGNKAGEAATLGNIGKVYSNLGEFQQALDYFQQALSLSRVLGNKAGEGAILNNIGKVYDDLGEFQQALDYFQQALSLLQAVGNKAGEAATLNNIGGVYSSLREKQTALDYYKQALLLIRQVGNLFGEATTLNNIGGVYSALGDQQTALDYFNQALPLLRKVGNISGEAGTLNNIGRVYDSLGDKQTALDYLNQALPLSRQVGDVSVKTATLFNLAVLKRSQGKLTEAKADIEAAIKIIEDLRGKIASEKLRQSYFAQVQNQGYYEFYIDLLMELHQQNPDSGYDAEALHISERSRARTLLELLTEAIVDIRAGVDPNLLAEEQRLNQQLSAQEKQRQDLVGRNYIQSELDQIKAAIDKTLAQLSDLETKIRQNSPTYANLKYPDPLTLAEIQPILDENTLLLEYALGKDNSYLFLVGKNSFSSYKLPPRAEIEAAVEEYLQLLKSPLQTDITSGQKLSDILLSPIADKLNNQRLIIVANGKLQLLPFAALPISDGVSTGALPLPTSSPSSPSPLIVNHEIISLPSFTSLAVQKKEWQKRPTAPKTLAVLADPVFGPSDPRLEGIVASTNQDLSKIPGLVRQGCTNLDRLYYTEEEANNILAQVPDRQEFSALGFDATREAAIAPNLQQYQMVHFATHGCINDNPLLSGLAFSSYDEQGKIQDSFLRLKDIFNLQLNAELVVLSACETGLGDNVSGEGIVGLTRGFMYAGARRVLVSLWSVNDTATAKLMSNYYQKMLQDKLTPVAALRAAQLEMWQGETWQSPYYWAAFTIQGDW